MIMNSIIEIHVKEWETEQLESRINLLEHKGYKVVSRTSNYVKLENRYWDFENLSAF